MACPAETNHNCVFAREFPLVGAGREVFVRVQLQAFQVLVVPVASTRWNTGMEIMSLANSCCTTSYCFKRSSLLKELLASLIAELALSLHQPM